MRIEDGSKAFLSKVAATILLTPEREKELARIIQKNSDAVSVQSAVNELATCNLKLVVGEACSYARKSGVDSEDLISAGNEGLMKAIYRFNPDKFGTRFSTYAVPWIRQGIRRAIYASSPVKIPSHVMNGMIKHKKMEDENGDLSDEDVMKEMDLTPKALKNIKAARVSHISLDSPLEEDSTTSVGQTIADENAKSPLNVLENDERDRILSEAMNGLSEMKRDIVLAQCLGDDKVKLADLGKKWNLSGERIRQLKEDALKELKTKILSRTRRKNEN